MDETDSKKDTNDTERVSPSTHIGTSLLDVNGPHADFVQALREEFRISLRREMDRPTRTGILFEDKDRFTHAKILPRWWPSGVKPGKYLPRDYARGLKEMIRRVNEDGEGQNDLN